MGTQKLDKVALRENAHIARIYYQFKLRHAVTGTYLKQISRRYTDQWWECSSPVLMDIDHVLFKCQAWREQRKIMIFTYKRTLKKIPTTLRQLLCEKTPMEALLNFKRTTRVGRHPREKEGEAEEPQRDKRCRKDVGRRKGDDESDGREEGGG